MGVTSHFLVADRGIGYAGCLLRMKTQLRRFLILLLFLTLSAGASAQTRGILAIAYEGGMITHPGASVGYFAQAKALNKWTIYGGGKLGFYYHRRYQTAVFLLPGVQAQRVGTKGFLWGVDLSAGPQRTFIPRAYEVNREGNIIKEKLAGISQWIIMPGFRIGRDLSVKRYVPLQWYINPQLQFRKPTIGLPEKYLIMSIGISYKL